MFYSRPMRRFQAVWGVATCLAVVGVAACGSRVELDTSGVALQSSANSAEVASSSSVASFDEAAATTQITTLFGEVLNGANVANIDFEAQRIEGATDPSMRPILEANGSNTIAQTLTTTVDSVKFVEAEECDLAGESSPCAEVIYTVASSGTELLKAQKGFAVLAGESWVMSRNTFCGLAELSGGPACP